jgi:L-lactate dehydrogenase complex protein LldG
VSDALLASFERYARAIGAQVSVVSDEAQAAQAIAGSAEGPIRCAGAVSERYPGLIYALEATGRTISIAEDVSEPDRSELAASLAGGVGVTLAHAGIAETGSLVLADDALVPRLLSMLADVCVVLVQETTLVRGLDEAGALLYELNAQGHRYVSLVTGPSRTADIERVLTIGVQGPKALHIVLFTGL